MLHIATVHYGSPDWIEIQARYLREHVSVPYQTWSSLEGIDASYASHFDHVLDLQGRHADKLNHLAFEITRVAAGEDLIMFLDGDAFPIADPMPLIRDGLARAPLLAVRRAENNGDMQPHPCFCVTSAGFWRELPGDWSYGYCWTDAEGGLMSDVGANLLRKLELTDTPWVEVLRSNRRNLDPLFFAIYGGCIYHHGAGFRSTNFGRIHLEGRPRPLRLPQGRVLRNALARVNWERQRRWERNLQSQQLRAAQRVRQTIEAGDVEGLTELV
jgi:hypothetical protein